MAPSTATNTCEQRLNDVLAAWYQQCEHGAEPDRAVLLLRHPDLADELAAFFAAKDHFERGARSLLPGSGGPSPALEIPVELHEHPRYRVQRFLGRGGMGAVYQAEHTLMERPVALKVIHPGLHLDPAALVRFRQEVKAAARLQHPNLVAAHDADQVAGLTFLVMEYVEGKSLGEYLSMHGPLPAAKACEYIRQAALGLAHAHATGCVHRDIKPHNLMLTPRGQVKVLDFGLARILCELTAETHLPSPPETTATPGDGLTTAGMIMGTLDYVAPEQARDPRWADHRADIYALGCTLYHLLSGRVPFPAESPTDKLARLLAEESRPPLEYRSDLPPGLADVVSRMMARRPEDRYQTAEEVAMVLAPFTAPSANQPRRTGWPHPWVIGLGVLGTLLCALTVIKVTTDRGEVVIETDDADIEVVVKGERIVRIVDPKTKKAYVLDRRDLTLAHADDPDGMLVTLDGDRPIILRRKGRKIAAVRLAAPVGPVKTYEVKDVPVRFLTPSGFKYRPQFFNDRNAKVSVKVTGPARDGPPAVSASIDLTRGEFFAGLQHETVTFRLPKGFRVEEPSIRVLGFELVPLDADTTR